MFWFRMKNSDFNNRIVGMRINLTSDIGEKEYMEYVNHLSSEYGFNLGSSINIAKDRVAFYNADKPTDGSLTDPMAPPFILGYNTNNHEFKVYTIDEFESNYIRYESPIVDYLYRSVKMTKNTECKLFRLYRKDNASVEYVGIKIDSRDDLESTTACDFFNQIDNMYNITITYETGSEGFLCILVDGRKIYATIECGFMIAFCVETKQVTTILENELSEYEMEEIENIVSNVKCDNETLYYIKFNFIREMIKVVNILKNVSQVIVDFNKYDPGIVKYVKRYKHIQYITDFFDQPNHYLIGECDGVSIIFTSNVGPVATSSCKSEITFFDNNKKSILKTSYDDAIKE